MEVNSEQLHKIQNLTLELVSFIQLLKEYRLKFKNLKDELIQLEDKFKEFENIEQSFEDKLKTVLRYSGSINKEFQDGVS